MIFSPKTKRRRILIVEDDWAILEVLKLMLEDEGYVVVTAKHGREAVALAATKPFDLVLMDISMPEMSGIEVAAILRSKELTADVLIAIHTGLDEHWVSERFSDYDLFLTKATDTDVLVDEIGKLFAQAPMTRARRVAATGQQLFTTEDLIVARQALRVALGLQSVSMTTQQFLAELGDEIGQLRRVGSSNAEIASLIGETVGKDIAASTIEDLDVP